MKSIAQSVIFYDDSKVWRQIKTPVFPQPPVRSCAAVMASTPGGAVSATAVGRAPSVTSRPPSVSIPSAADTDCVWRVTVCATPATRDPTVSKVNGEKKRVLPVGLEAARSNIFLCEAPWVSTQSIGETIGVFNSTEQIMPRMLLLILCI